MLPFCDCVGTAPPLVPEPRLDITQSVVTAAAAAVVVAVAVVVTASVVVTAGSLVTAVWSFVGDGTGASSRVLPSF